MPTSTKMPTYPKPKGLKTGVGSIAKEEAAEKSISKQAAMKPMAGKSCSKR